MIDGIDLLNIILTDRESSDLVVLSAGFVPCASSTSVTARFLFGEKDVALTLAASELREFFYGDNASAKTEVLSGIEQKLFELCGDHKAKIDIEKMRTLNEVIGPLEKEHIRGWELWWRDYIPSCEDCTMVGLAIAWKKGRNYYVAAASDGEVHAYETGDIFDIHSRLNYASSLDEFRRERDLAFRTLREFLMQGNAD